MTTARMYHTLTVLPDGRVFVSGSQGPGFMSGAGPPLDSVEMFDPTPREFAEAAPMFKARRWHTASLLNNGTVFVVGGHGTSSI